MQFRPRVAVALGDEVIVGLGGGDVILGSWGYDVICGGDGDDRITGGVGLFEVNAEQRLRCP